MEVGLEKIVVSLEVQENLWMETEMELKKMAVYSGLGTSFLGPEELETEVDSQETAGHALAE